jgi:hypothetical protein
MHKVHWKYNHFWIKLILMQIIIKLSVSCDRFIRHLPEIIKLVTSRLGPGKPFFNSVYISWLYFCSSFVAFFCQVWHIRTLIFINVVPQRLLAVPDWLPRGDRDRPASRRRLWAAASGRRRIRSLSAGPLGTSRPRVRVKIWQNVNLALGEIIMLTVKTAF